MTDDEAITMALLLFSSKRAAAGKGGGQLFMHDDEKAAKEKPSWWLFDTGVCGSSFYTRADAARAYLNHYNFVFKA